MKLKGLNIKELQRLEEKLEKDIRNCKETIAREQIKLKS